VIWERNRWILDFLFLILLFGGLPPCSQGKGGETTIPASRIRDRDVYDGKQKLVGEVDDLIIGKSGTVKRLTVGLDDFLDVGGKLVAISSKNFRMENGNVVLEATEQPLGKMRKFDEHRYHRQASSSNDRDLQFRSWIRFARKSSGTHVALSFDSISHSMNTAGQKFSTLLQWPLRIGRRVLLPMGASSAVILFF